MAGPNRTEVTNTPGRADTVLGVCTSHIYCHHLIPHRVEEALPLQSRLKLILTTLSRNSATKLCALPPPRAGPQVGDICSTQALEEEDLFAAALSVCHPQGCTAGGYHTATTTVGKGQRGHTAPGEATPGSGPPAWEGGQCPRGPPGPGERVPGYPRGPGGEAALRQLALRPGLEQHRLLSPSLCRAEQKTLPPTACYGYRDCAAGGNCPTI